MDGGRALRSRTLAPPAPAKAPENKTQNKNKNKNIQPRTSLTSTTGSQRSSLTSRLSTASNTPTPRESFENRIKSLEARLTTVEASFNELEIENTELRRTVTALQSEFEQFKTELKSTVVNLQSELAEVKSRNELSLATSVNSSTDQQDINTNIIIRGVDVSESASLPELTTIYEGIRSHLEVSDVAEFDPVSISLLPSNSSKPNSTLRPIRVKLSSVSAKVKFLQVRRIKRDIVQSNIGLASNSKRPILITEQLTRANQELLFQARSLREGGNYKFVWSKNGEVFARYRPNAKVIKVIDTTHVNSLRAELKLEPLPNNGRLFSSAAQQSAADRAGI